MPKRFWLPYLIFAAVVLVAIWPGELLFRLYASPVPLSLSTHIFAALGAILLLFVCVVGFCLDWKLYRRIRRTP